MFSKYFAVAALTVATVSGAQAATLTNGSFEHGMVPQIGYQTIDSSSDFLTGWTVINNIDVISNAFWDASEGSQSLDLIGNQKTGGVAQTISDLIVGTTYEVTFDYASNFAVTDTVGMIVGSGDESATFTYTKDATATQMEWVTGTFTFTADATSEELSFFSNLGNRAGNGGIALDNVAINAIAAVPLPAGGLLILSALGMLGFARRKA